MVNDINLYKWLLENNEAETQDSNHSTTQSTHNPKAKTFKILYIFFNKEGLCTLLGVPGGQCFVGADLFQPRWTLASPWSCSPHCFRVTSISIFISLCVYFALRRSGICIKISLVIMGLCLIWLVKMEGMGIWHGSGRRGFVAICIQCCLLYSIKFFLYWVWIQHGSW